MAVAVRSVGTVAPAASQTALVVPVPAGVANGDILLMAVFLTATTGVITSPAGWNIIFANSVPASSTSSHASIFWRLASSEPASYTITTTSGRATGVMIALTGADTAAPIDVSGSAVDTTAGLTAVAPTVTAVTAGMLFTFAGGRVLPNASNVAWALASQTEDADITAILAANSGSSLYAGHEQLSATGATGTRSPVATIATTIDWVAYNVVIKAAAVSAPTGTAASSFGWSDTATAVETITGTAASAFGWSDTAAGSSAEPVTGTGASAFGWSDTATGAEGFTGTSDVAFGWSDSAAGSEGFVGASDAAFGWTTAGSASEGLSGVAASQWAWSTAATGASAEPVTGVAASTFSAAIASTGAQGSPAVSGTAASTFGWSTAGAGTQTSPAVTGTGASAFAGSIAGTGAVTALAPTGVAASTFGWSTAGVGTHTEPYVAPPPQWNTITRQTTRSAVVNKF